MNASNRHRHRAVRNTLLQASASITRRSALLAGAAGIASSLAGCAAPPRSVAAPKLRITDFELLPVRATERTVWLLVRVLTDAGLTGLGEASDAFGFANTTKQDAAAMESELRRFFSMMQDRSPLEVAVYRASGREAARSGGLVSATAYSALEQAMWDLAGQALEVPTYALFGGAVRDRLSVYANINRATQPRAPEGFAETARRAREDGFAAMKAAPFDGFPNLSASTGEIRAAVEQGIAALEAMREAVGPDVELMVDCHSFFDVPLSQEVARRLEGVGLAWYEEPVPPEQVAETTEIHSTIRQPMAGGELLFGVEGFLPLCQAQAIDVIMPDVKHCGGLLELTQIAAMAAAYGIEVAPHNPSGPVSTAASVQVGAGMPNLRLLELQWGEAPWRSELLDPPERFEAGTIAVPDRPGFGIRLNEELVNQHLL